MDWDGLDHLLQKLTMLVLINHSTDSSRLRTARTVDNVDAVAEEEQLQTHRSVRLIALELSIP